MRKQQQPQGCIVRKGGWWCLRFRQQCCVEGKPKNVLRSVRLVPVDARHKTKRSVRCDERIAERIDELIAPKRNKLAPETVLTLGDFTELVYLPHVEQSKRPSTVKGYKDMWRYHVKKRSANAWLRDVRTRDIQGWLQDIAGADGLSKTTLKHIKHFLSGVFRYAAQQDYFDSGKANPAKAASIPDVLRQTVEPHATTLEEVKQMFAVLGEPARTAVAMAAFTGIRKGEFAQGWENYTPPGSNGSMGLLNITLSVWRGHFGQPKTKKSKAAVPVIAPLAKMLETHRLRCGNPSTGPIFANSVGRPLDLDGLYRREMKEPLRQAGIEWHGWHAFRRGLATNLNRLGISDKLIQQVMRHSDISTTQNIYIKPTCDDAMAAMQHWEQSEQLRDLESVMFPSRSQNDGNVPRAVVN